MPGRLYNAHTMRSLLFSSEDTEVVIILFIMALHLAFPALPSMAPLSDDLFLFLSSRLIQPNSISGVYLSSRRGCQFFPTLYHVYRRVGWIAVNRLLSESDIFGWNFMIYIALRLDRWTCNQGGLEFNSRPCLKLDFVSRYFRLEILARPCKIVRILPLLMCNWMPFNYSWNVP